MTRKTYPVCARCGQKSGYPLAKVMGWTKEMLTAALVLPVIGLVWLMIRRIRRAMH